VSSMSERTTLAPWWAKRRAAALPTPWPAPVMMATYWGVSVGGISWGNERVVSLNCRDLKYFNAATYLIKQ
jgi:hypothetical protein